MGPNHEKLIAETASSTNFYGRKKGELRLIQIIEEQKHIR